MPIFTSNSDERLPNIPYKKIWLLIFLSLFLFTASWDIFWITRKVGPLPKDDEKLWSYHRRRVAGLNNTGVVLIGSSRMQTGLDQSKFTQLTGRRTIQLAVSGESPIPVLQNLAEDESFNGTIISDFGEFLIYTREINPNSNRIINYWIQDYKESKSSDDFEFMLRGYGRYILATPTLGKNFPDALGNIITGKAFQQRSADQIINDTKQSYFDRTLIFDMDTFLSKEDKDAIVAENKNRAIQTLKEFSQNIPPNSNKYLEIIDKIESYVKQIQSRGGKVIIVNFPMSGELERLNEIAFPRDKFWDVFTTKTSAVTIHYKDYPQLQFVCPDDSHLDAKDTPLFTENLVKIIYVTSEN